MEGTAEAQKASSLRYNPTSRPETSERVGTEFGCSFFSRESLQNVSSLLTSISSMANGRRAALALMRSSMF